VRNVDVTRKDHRPYIVHKLSYSIMDPVYSRDECIAAIRNFYEFMATMFMDYSYIVEPPQGGWPCITAESMQGIRKTEEVTQLLRHLPYIVNRPRTNHPQCLPGCMPNDWATTEMEIIDGKDHPDLALNMTEGYDGQFGGRIPKRCVGLMYGGRNKDVVVLDTSDELVTWMACPDKVLKASFPKPSTLVCPLPEVLDGNPDTCDEARNTIDDSENNASENGRGNGFAIGEETPPTSDDDRDNEDIINGDSDDGDSTVESDDADEMSWGPSWSVRHFFEMLKNHYRCLVFIPRDAHHVIDIWTDTNPDVDPLPKGIPEMLRGIYCKHGWPDLNKYRKTDCLAEVERELDEKYSGHWGFYK
jgi:hypothetical protein